MKHERLPAKYGIATGIALAGITIFCLVVGGVGYLLATVFLALLIVGRIRQAMQGKSPNTTIVNGTSMSVRIDGICILGAMMWIGYTGTALGLW